jgi:hypothetical protein
MDETDHHKKFRLLRCAVTATRHSHAQLHVYAQHNFLLVGPLAPESAVNGRRRFHGWLQVEAESSFLLVGPVGTRRAVNGRRPFHGWIQVEVEAENSFLLVGPLGTTKWPRSALMSSHLHVWTDYQVRGRR